MSQYPPQQYGGPEQYGPPQPYGAPPPQGYGYPPQQQPVRLPSRWLHLRYPGQQLTIHRCINKLHPPNKHLLRRTAAAFTDGKKLTFAAVFTLLYWHGSLAWQRCAVVGCAERRANAAWTAWHAASKEQMTRWPRQFAVCRSFELSIPFHFTVIAWGFGCDGFTGFTCSTANCLFEREMFLWSLTSCPFVKYQIIKAFHCFPCADIPMFNFLPPSMSWYPLANGSRHGTCLGQASSPCCRAARPQTGRIRGPNNSQLVHCSPK